MENTNKKIKNSKINLNKKHNMLKSIGGKRMSKFRKFKSLSLNNYKNITDWVTLDLFNNNSVKSKVSLMGKNGVGKTNFLNYFTYIPKFLNGVELNNSKKYPINSEFEIEIILGDYDLTVYGKFQTNKIEETILPLDIEFKLSDSKDYNFKISSDYLKKQFDMDINILQLNKDNLVYITKLYLENKDMLTDEDISFCTLFKISYSKERKITQKIYNEEIFNTTLGAHLKDVLRRIHYMDCTITPKFEGSEWSLNINNILSFFIENPKIFQKIVTVVEKLDCDLKNIRLQKNSFTPELYELVFDNRKNETLSFEHTSGGSMRFFTLLCILLYLENKNYYELVLIDEVDSSLNDHVLRELILMLSSEIQYVFTHHRNSILSKNLDVFKPEEMYFFTEEHEEKSIDCLIQYENWEKYKHTNELLYDLLENLLGTSPEF